MKCEIMNNEKQNEYIYIFSKTCEIDIRTYNFNF